MIRERGRGEGRDIRDMGRGEEGIRRREGWQEDIKGDGKREKTE